jgi:hypothetical protein
LYEDNVDPREFIKIDVGDHWGWTRAEASMRLKNHKYKLVYEKGDPKALQFHRTCAVSLSHSGGFCSASSKIRTFSNRRHSPNSCGQFFISLMNFITDPSSHPYPTAITDTSLLMRNVLIAHSPLRTQVHGVPLEAIPVPLLLSVAHKSIRPVCFAHNQRFGLIPCRSGSNCDIAL